MAGPKDSGRILLNKICDSLGLPETVCGVTLVVKLNECPRLIVEQRPTNVQAEVLGSVFEHREYDLVEKQTALSGE